MCVCMETPVQGMQSGCLLDKQQFSVEEEEQTE